MTKRDASTGDETLSPRRRTVVIGLAILGLTMVAAAVGWFDALRPLGISLRSTDLSQEEWLYHEGRALANEMARRLRLMNMESRDRLPPDYYLSDRTSPFEYRRRSLLLTDAALDFPGLISQRSVAVRDGSGDKDTIAGFDALLESSPMRWFIMYREKQRRDSTLDSARAEVMEGFEVAAALAFDLARLDTSSDDFIKLAPLYRVRITNLLSQAVTDYPGLPGIENWQRASVNDVLRRLAISTEVPPLPVELPVRPMEPGLDVLLSKFGNSPKREAHELRLKADRTVRGALNQPRAKFEKMMLAAVDDYIAALRIYPGYLDVMINLGLTNYFFGDKDKGEALITQVLGRLPNHPQAHQCLSYMRYDQGSGAEAILEANFALRYAATPGFNVWPSLAIKGLVYLRDGHTSRARRAFKLALEEDPNLPLPLFNLGVLYQFLEADLDRAEEYYWKALEADAPRKLVGKVLERLALAHAYDRGDLERCREVYEKIVKAKLADRKAYARAMALAKEAASGG